MGKSKKPHKKSKKSRQVKRKIIKVDETSVGEIIKYRQHGERYIKFNWDYYFDLAYQRSKIEDDLKQALLEAVTDDFEFKNWKRVIKYEYSNSPLSVVGSLLNVGGRFNIGDIDQPTIASFPALYIARDFNTGLKEYFCPSFEKIPDKINYDSALSNPSSFTNLSLSGHLEQVIDLRRSDSLKPFVNLIKDFKVSDALKKEASLLKVQINLITTVPQFLYALLDGNWRVNPIWFDVPASSQIFGHLVANTGIEGIIYPSRLTKKECISVFPQNFCSEESFVELADKAPKATTLTRIDTKIWKKHQGKLMGK